MGILTKVVLLKGRWKEKEFICLKMERNMKVVLKMTSFMVMASKQRQMAIVTKEIGLMR